MDRHPDSPTTPRPRVWIPIGVALGSALSLAAIVGRHVLGTIEDGFARSEHERAQQVADLRAGLDEVRGVLSGIKSDLGSAKEESARAAELSERLQHAEEHLGSIGAAIEAHSSTLIELEEAQATFVPDLEEEMRERDERLTKRYEALSELAENARRAARDSQERVAQLDHTLSTPPDLERMWRDLVGPVVQLAGEASVGSGVLLPSQPRAEGGYHTPILTAWHVVRDIQGDPPDFELPVPVQIYREDGSTRNEKAKLLAHDPKLDAALLEIVTPDALEFGARLAPRSRLADTRIFDQIVAVGCPLGNDPIPTRGEVATCHHEVDGEHYWMINAPTYIGNSGGGIFDSKTHELMGIFSKIYTHGSLRPTIVPHMGLVTPLDKVYDWLVDVGHGDLVPSETHPSEAAAASGQ
jgi:S1-C subfamily serine protease